MVTEQPLLSLERDWPEEKRSKSNRSLAFKKRWVDGACTALNSFKLVGGNQEPVDFWGRRKLRPWLSPETQVIHMTVEMTRHRSLSRKCESSHILDWLEDKSLAEKREEKWTAIRSEQPLFHGVKNINLLNHLQDMFLFFHFFVVLTTEISNLNI